jgi:hypothetical protein
LECIKKVIRPLALLEIDTLDAPICPCYSPRRQTTAAAAAATTRRFFWFFDDT